MKKLFARNELTSRIMTLHSDVKDILYGCRCMYDEGNISENENHSGRKRSQGGIKLEDYCH